MKTLSMALLALGASCAALILPHPANAAITAATITVTGPSSYTGSCPHTVQFTGTINGTPGTVFTVSFNRFVNGMQHIVTLAPVTMPANGVEPVSDSISIASSTSGTTFDQIWVHNISGGQADVYSNKANFTVNCGPPPTPIPTGIPKLPPPAPNSLTNTTDPPTCTTHAGIGGGLACYAGIPKGMLALIWSWSPGACSDCIDGYNVYRVDGGQHTRVTQQNAKLDSGLVATLAVLDKPSDGFNGKCYVVTAYYQGLESNDSNYFCPGGYAGGPIVESFTLQPSAVRSVYHHYSYTGFGPGCGLSNTGTGPPNGDHVGFIHSYVSASGFTCGEDTFVYQTAVNFNLGGAGIILRNSKASVQSARLLFRRVDGGTVNCMAGVHLPTGDWSNAQDLIPNNDFISGIPWGTNTDINTGTVKIANGNDSIDVATAISNWAKGVWSSDYGFVLIGGNEDTSGFHDNNSCDSQVGSFVLSLQIVINP